MRKYLLALLIVGCGFDPVARVSSVHEVAEDHADRVKQDLEAKISDLESEVQRAKADADEAKVEAAEAKVEAAEVASDLADIRTQLIRCRCY